jgi:hypothetical protein
MARKSRLPKASKTDQEYVKKFASRSVFDRLAEGQLEVVPADEIPESLAAIMGSRDGVWIPLSPRDLRRLLAASEQSGVAPGKLVAQWTRERLRSRHAG